MNFRISRIPICINVKFSLRCQMEVRGERNEHPKIPRVASDTRLPLEIEEGGRGTFVISECFINEMQRFETQFSGPPAAITQTLFLELQF